MKIVDYDELALYENKRISTVVNYQKGYRIRRLYENKRISTVVDVCSGFHSPSLYENKRISTVVDTDQHQGKGDSL